MSNLTKYFLRMILLVTFGNFFVLQSWAAQKVNLDASCGYEQFVSLQMKQQCLLSHDNKDACLSLGIFSYLNGKKGDVPAKALTSLLNGMSEEIKTKFTKALDAITRIKREITFLRAALRSKWIVISNE